MDEKEACYCFGCKKNMTQEEYDEHFVYVAPGGNDPDYLNGEYQCPHDPQGDLYQEDESST